MLAGETEDIYLMLFNHERFSSPLRGRSTHLERAFPNRDMVAGRREAERREESSGKGEVLESENTPSPARELVYASRPTTSMQDAERRMGRTLTMRYVAVVSYTPMLSLLL